MLKETHSFSNKGVNAIQVAIELKQDEKPSKKEYDFYLEQNDISEKETRTWKSLGMSMGIYTLIDGSACSNSVPIIGWEEVVRTMPRYNRIEKKVVDEVKEVRGGR
jgi:hypothetical protein